MTAGTCNGKHCELMTEWDVSLIDAQMDVTSLKASKLVGHTKLQAACGKAAYLKAQHITVAGASSNSPSEDAVRQPMLVRDSSS